MHIPLFLNFLKYALSNKIPLNTRLIKLTFLKSRVLRTVSQNEKICDPVPDISVEVQPVEEYEDGYTIRVNGYESPFSIILSTERINDEYPIYSDTTTLSESFFVEYPVVYIKLFAKFKDGESDRYNPATVIVSADGQVLLLMEGAFYSLERR